MSQAREEIEAEHEAACLPIVDAMTADAVPESARTACALSRRVL